MTEAPDPRSDEIASAYLDGEATPTEVTLVESSPALVARVGELRAVAGLVAEPVPRASALDRERAIRAALAAAEAPATARDTAGADVVSLSESRAARARRWFPAAGAAAAVLLILALGAVALRDRDDADQTAGGAASTALATAKESGADGDSGGGTGGAGSAAPEAGDLSAAGGIEDLGVFDSEDDLVAAIDARREAQDTAVAVPAPSTTAPGVDESASRSGVPCSDAAAGALVYAARVTYRDVPALVLVYEIPGGSRLLVVHEATCRVLTTLDR